MVISQNIYGSSLQALLDESYWAKYNVIKIIHINKIHLALGSQTWAVNTCRENTQSYTLSLCLGSRRSKLLSWSFIMPSMDTEPSASSGSWYSQVALVKQLYSIQD
jgi:hypothetical protein